MSASEQHSPAAMAPLAGTPEPVWVGTRLRPLNPAERRRKEATAWQAVNGKTLKLLDPLEKLGPYGGSSFTYDGVFGPTSSSEEVYSAAARDRVGSAMQVCFSHATLHSAIAFQNYHEVRV